MSEIEALTNCGAIVKLSVMCGLCRYDLVLFSGLISNADFHMHYFIGILYRYMYMGYMCLLTYIVKIDLFITSCKF